MIGIDEVGRGAWAGPLLVVAFRPAGPLPPGLNDSKLVTAARRRGIHTQLEACGDIGEGWVTPAEIDSAGLAGGLRLGVERALLAIGAEQHEIIIFDGPINYCPEQYANVITMIKADQKIPAVSAASIWAKVVRDDHMKQQAETYPDYGFDKHVGYGTAAHQLALKTFGICQLHRLSYEPIRLIQEGAA